MYIPIKFSLLLLLLLLYIVIELTRNLKFQCSHISDSFYVTARLIKVRN